MRSKLQLIHFFFHSSTKDLCQAQGYWKKPHLAFTMNQMLVWPALPTSREERQAVSGGIWGRRLGEGGAEVRDCGSCSHT